MTPEQRISGLTSKDRAINEWKNDCCHCRKTALRTGVVTFDIAKTFLLF